MGSKFSTNRKYQIFISSTFEDMEEERRTAVEMILRTDNIPAGMEQFPSGNWKSWDIIKEWIDASDIYLLILGGRYGTVDPSTGKSFTHMEYEYAIETQKPMFACVINEDYLNEKIRLHGRDKVTERDNLAKYHAFMDLVRGKECDFYSSLDDLSNHISCGIPNTIRRYNDLSGWVRDCPGQMLGVEESRKLFDICRMYNNHYGILEAYGRLNSVKMDDELSKYYVEMLGQLLASCTTGELENILELNGKMFALFVKNYRLNIEHMSGRLSEFEGKPVYTSYRGTKPMQTYRQKKKEFKECFAQTETESFYPQNKTTALDAYKKVFLMGQELLKVVEEMEDDFLRGEYHGRNDYDRTKRIRYIYKIQDKTIKESR